MEAPILPAPEAPPAIPARPPSPLEQAATNPGACPPCTDREQTALRVDIRALFRKWGE